MSEESSIRSNVVNDQLIPVWVVRGLWIVSGCVLLLNLPIFLCQHLTADTVMYDLQAQSVFAGGVLYRDVIEPNLPGAVAIHIVVRSIAGWTSVAMRSFDLLVLLVSLSFLSQLIFSKVHPQRIQKTVFLSFAVLFFYFGQSEWCHCQRDTWLLCPSLLATLIRRNRLEQQARGTAPVWCQSSLLEGFFWGIAFWMKPHVTVPVLFVLLISWFETRQPMKSIRDLFGVVVGGAIAGAIGIGLLILNGAWEPFWVMQLEWNPEYVKVGRQNFTLDRFTKLWGRLLPWAWMHFGAVVVSIGVLWQSRIHREEESQVQQNLGQRLLIGLYFGWMAQALLLQHPFTYIQVPGIILAIAIVGSIEWSPRFVFAGRFIFVLFAAATVPTSPLVSLTRLSQVENCLRDGSTLAVRSKIQQQSYPDWKEMQPVLEYLRTQNVQEQDVTVYTGTLIHVYQELDLKPTTRYVYVDVLARIFKGRSGEIQDALTQSKHRFVVSGLLEAGVSRDDVDGERDPETLLPINFPQNALKQFPYTQSVVFRSGQYLVHRVNNPVGEICTEYFPLANMKHHSEN